MSTTIIEKLVAAGGALVGNTFRAIAGRREDTGVAVPFRVDYLGQLRSVPGLGINDPFGRSRMSLPVGLIDVKQVLDNAPLLLDTATVGGGTAIYSQNIASTNMNLTAANGDSVIRQTKQYAPYQPGRSQLAILTGVMGALKTNVWQGIGYFDTNNGLFFQQNGVSLSVVRRTFATGVAVDNIVDQASWNLDTLDGSGNSGNPSGVSINTAKIQVFIIDFSWLGSGGGRLGFLFLNAIGEARIVYCHQFVAANTLTSVYMSTPTLPLRWEIRTLPPRRRAQQWFRRAGPCSRKEDSTHGATTSLNP